MKNMKRCRPPHCSSLTVESHASAATLPSLRSSSVALSFFLYYAFFVTVHVVPHVHAIPAHPLGFRFAQPMIDYHDDDGNLTSSFHPLLHMRGDEHLHHTVDSHGYTVLRDADDNGGWAMYATRNETSGELVSSGLRAGIDDPRSIGLVPGLLPRGDGRRRPGRRLLPRQRQTQPRRVNAKVKARTGRLRNLVILVRFADHKSPIKRTLPSPSDYDILLNRPGGHETLAPTGSVRDVYRSNSGGRLDVTSTVLGWTTLSHPEAYYAHGTGGTSVKFDEAVFEALDHAQRKLERMGQSIRDFDEDGDGLLDAVTVVHSGYGAEWGGNDCGTDGDDGDGDGADVGGAAAEDRIWTHQRENLGRSWCSGGNGNKNRDDAVCTNRSLVASGLWGRCGSTIGRIGAIAHELGHFLGLDDMYDGVVGPDGRRGGNGIGAYGLMGNVWGFDGSQLYPPSMDPWSKILLGWDEPTVLTSSGTYLIKSSSADPDDKDADASDADTSAATIYKIDCCGFPDGEFLLIENRQPTEFDAALPGVGGLAIWHIDSTAPLNDGGHPGQQYDDDDVPWPRNGRHYRVALLQADGRYDLERGNDHGDDGDLFHSDGVDFLGPSSSDVGDGGPFPNTDAYRDGDIVRTGVVIRDVSRSGRVMSFTLELPDGGHEDSPPPVVESIPEDGADAEGETQESSNYVDLPVFAIDFAFFVPPPPPFDLEDGDALVEFADDALMYATIFLNGVLDGGDGGRDEGNTDEDYGHPSFEGILLFVVDAFISISPDSSGATATTTNRHAVKRISGGDGSVGMAATGGDGGGSGGDLRPPPAASAAVATVTVLFGGRAEFSRRETRRRGALPSADVVGAAILRALNAEHDNSVAGGEESFEEFLRDYDCDDRFSSVDRLGAYLLGSKGQRRIARGRGPFSFSGGALGILTVVVIVVLGVLILTCAAVLLVRRRRVAATDGKLGKTPKDDDDDGAALKRRASDRVPSSPSTLSQRMMEGGGSEASTSSSSSDDESVRMTMESSSAMDSATTGYSPVSTPVQRMDDDDDEGKQIDDASPSSQAIKRRSRSSSTAPPNDDINNENMQLGRMMCPSPGSSTATSGPMQGGNHAQQDVSFDIANHERAVHAPLQRIDKIRSGLGLPLCSLKDGRSRHHPVKDGVESGSVSATHNDVVVEYESNNAYLDLEVLNDLLVSVPSFEVCAIMTAGGEVAKEDPARSSLH